MPISLVAGTLLTALATAYAVVALFARARRYRGQADGPVRLPVSVLKPLCGDEPHLEENLETLCLQDYPDFEIVCGVRDPEDSALAVVERLRARFPQIRLRVVVDARVHGNNLKVSNLINIERETRNDWLVIADSDISVAPDYLTRVTGPLADEKVGVVTCLYRGRAHGSLMGRLGRLFIDTWFAPSVRVASAFGSQDFAFGATLALRRSTLDAIGGLAAVRNRLADDYWLGALSRQLGLATVLSDVEVVTDVAESRGADLWGREVRWLRTIRSLNRAGFALLFVTYTLPVVAVGALLADSTAVTAMAAVAVLARMATHFTRAGWRDWWLAPVRDTLLLIEWAVALGGQSVTWRESRLTVDGRAHVSAPIPASTPDSSPALRETP